MQQLRNLILIVLAGTLGSRAWAQPKPVLSISFDAGLDGVGLAGRVAAVRDGNPVLVPGRTGHALKSGPGTGFVEYPTAGLIMPTGGTVEMWVCPLDWRPEDQEFHVFFDTRNKGGLYLYKYFEGTRLLTLGCEDTGRGPYTECPFDVRTWKPGEWHHIAGTWGPVGVMTYVDGKPARKAPVGRVLPAAFGARLRIGDHPWHLPRQSSSLIDEVRIYDRPLSAAHIAAHFAGNENFVAPITAEIAILKVEVQPDPLKIVAQLSTGGADVEDARLRARCAVVRPGEALPAAAAAVPFATGQAIQALTMPATEPGEYQVVAAVLLDGKPAFELRQPLVIPDLWWRGNRVGLEDRVLPPWTPLQASASQFRCWGREVTFGPAALPVQITSAGDPLLARPIAVTATVAGKPITWTTQPLRLLRASDTRAEWAGELAGHAAGQPVRLTVALAAEYDGVLVVDLSGAEFARLAVDRFSIEIPVRPERSLYRHRWGPMWGAPAGVVPAGEGVVDRSPFLPFAWLGDNDRGLFWFCESDQFWPNGESDHAFEIVRRTGTEVALRINLVAPGQKLPANWIYRFGLQATPVKPLPRDWRKWRLLPAKSGNVSIQWPSPTPDSLRYYGYPEATTPARFAKRVAELHARNVKAVPYLCLTFLSTGCPEWPFFGSRWGGGMVDTAAVDAAAYGDGFAHVSPLGAGYSDFVVGKTARFAEQYRVDGLYHDNTGPYSSTVLAANCGYDRDGHRRKTYPILGYRALYRRMYSVVKSWPRETFTMAHMSGKVTIPILAYDDSCLNGEQFRGLVKDSYLDLFTLDAFRAEFIGRQWGVMPFFLAQFDAATYAKQVEPTRGMMALLLVHDVSLWADVCNVAVVDHVYGEVDAFGIVEAEFLPYFAAVPPATTDLPDVLASGYRRSDGRVLLIVANLARQQRSGTVRLNPAGLQLPHIAQVLAWPEKTPLARDGQRLTLTVPGLGYRLLVVEPPAVTLSHNRSEGCVPRATASSTCAH